MNNLKLTSTERLMVIDAFYAKAFDEQIIFINENGTVTQYPNSYTVTNVRPFGFKDTTEYILAVERAFNSIQFLPGIKMQDRSSIDNILKILAEDNTEIEPIPEEEFDILFDKSEKEEEYEYEVHYSEEDGWTI